MLRGVNAAAAYSYVYTLRLIWPISYPGECDLMGHPHQLLPSYVL